MVAPPAYLAMVTNDEIRAVHLGRFTPPPGELPGVRPEAFRRPVTVERAQPWREAHIDDVRVQVEMAVSGGWARRCGGASGPSTG